MSEADRNLHKKLYDRCRKRLIRAGFDPKVDVEDFAEKLESCIRTERYKHKIAISKDEDPSPKRPSREEQQLDILKEQLSDLELRRFLRRRQAREDAEDIRAIENINKGLWESGESDVDRETQMKEMSEKLNERLTEMTDKMTCPKCLSSVCRCPQNGGEDEQ